MRFAWRELATVLAVGVAATPALAQAPAAAAPAAAAAGAPPGSVDAATVAAGAAKPGFFAKMCDALENCKRKLCKSPAGKLLGGMTAPLSFATGGVIPGFCPVGPSAQDLLKPGVAGAANGAKKDALEAAERRAAVRYLGTLDCRYYPDAEGALISALRTDGSECVRFEAASVLGRGCCCTKKTIEALEVCVSGTERDGNPGERSLRVRCAAARALDRCLSCYQHIEEAEPAEPVDPLPKPKELPPATEKPGPNEPTKDEKKDAAKVKSDRMPDAKTIARAKKTLAEFAAKVPPEAVLETALPTPASEKTLYHILRGGSGEETVVVSTVIAESKPTAAKPVALPTVPTVMPQAMTAPMLPSPSLPVTTPVAVEAPRPLPVVKPVEAAKPIEVVVPVVKPVEAAKPIEVVVPVVKPVEAAKPIPAPVPVTTPVPALAPAPVSTTRPADPVPVQFTAPVSQPRLPQTAPAATPLPTIPSVPVSAKPVESTPVVTVSAKSETSPQTLAAATATDPAELKAAVNKLYLSPGAKERHAAIRELVKFDWKQNPAVARALISHARFDSFEAVRVDCLRHLVAYKMVDTEILGELSRLTLDKNDWVREEATKAYTTLRATK